MSVKILIVVPCYNEEASLPLVLDQLRSIKLPAEYKCEILVINDCSKDKTSDVAKRFNVTVLDLPMNLGIGGAVQTGFKYANHYGFDIAIQLDGDGQHPPDELIKLINCYTSSGADVIIGSRFLESEGFQSSFIRRLGINYFYYLNRLMTNNTIYDSTSGFRLLGKRAISIAARDYPSDYPEPESLVIFAKAGLKIKEVPVLMRARLGGQSSIHHTASIFYSIKVTLSMFFSFLRN